ncbi:MAG TPA: hypothetical protein VHU84_15870, partial [Lacipirellulaceae bacterium]|nr:hypothetical protein [Lacipirellulaceae bacterium]
MTVDIGGADAEAAKHLHIDVAAVDSDGVATIASELLSQSSGSNDVRTVTVYTQVGRGASPIRISLFDGDAELDSISLDPNAAANSKLNVAPIPATTDLIAVLSASPANIGDAFANRGLSGSQTGRRLIELNKVTALPTEWYGYDAVNVLIIPVGDGQLCKDLAADKSRFAALNRWLQLGGRLVILCGGQNAQAIIGANGPLTSLIPGRFAGIVPLRETGPLEHYASASAITGASIEVPRLTDVDGNIDAYAEGRATRLPLIVRSPRGFGEITFVGVEFDRPPLVDWSGRTAFLHALLHPYLIDAIPTDSTQKLVTSGFNDLSGALRQRLGQNFTLVVPIGFPVVAGLAVAYLMFLGPVDYLLVHRWVRRPLVAWVTLPIMIGGFTAAAIAISNWSKGVVAPRLNRLELIDVDTIAKKARGTLWTALYSPDAQQFDLSVTPSAKAVDPSSAAEVLFSWWGLPGLGIGGMQTSNSDLG